MKFFLCVVGMVMILEGLPWFAFPEKMKQVLAMLFTQKESQLRVMGIALMLVGLVLVFFGKQ
ncbi:MAG: DUF2065 domain-containing protein [Proteobacteria bacterium]|nr:DUF2065 domain-containing protein [Pseudomonadota bacterium]